MVFSFNPAALNAGLLAGAVGFDREPRFALRAAQPRPQMRRAGDGLWRECGNRADSVAARACEP
jgi:endonuclease YncB( thermonuclease family)